MKSQEWLTQIWPLINGSVYIHFPANIDQRDLEIFEKYWGAFCTSMKMREAQSIMEKEKEFAVP